MRKLFYLALVFLLVSYISAHSKTLEAVVSKDRVKSTVTEDNLKKYVVLDSATNLPVPFAKIILPKENFTTYTDANGRFDINTKIKENSILAVQKEGYRPFSLTIKDSENPFTVKIDTAKPFDVVIDSSVCHLGDNVYSPTSANCHQFKAKSVGNSYTKTFNLKKQGISQNFYFVIGTLIGLDTRLAKVLGQNWLTTAYSSPAEVFLNGNKISELHVNGDNLRVKLPNNLIRNGDNTITVKTGKNVTDSSVLDYDDIEFMNLSVITE